MARKKLTVLASGIATVAIIAGAGVAYAGFRQTTETDPIQGSAATMATVEVVSASYTTDTSDGKLWPATNDAEPDHYATVVLTLHNPNPVPMNIAPADVTLKSVMFTASDDINAACGAHLKAFNTISFVSATAADASSTGALVGGKVHLEKNGSGGLGQATVTVKGVYLDSSTPGAASGITCQGQDFKTVWTITGESA